MWTWIFDPNTIWLWLPWSGWWYQRHPPGNWPKVLLISCENFKHVCMIILPDLFILTNLVFSNLVSMCYCGYISRQIYPLKILCWFDDRGMKGGWQKFSVMKVLVCHIERSAIFVNIQNLLVNPWTLR